MVLRDANDLRRQDAYWTGADLAVEVVSEDDPGRDLITKRLEYAQAGIPEYWIVDPLLSASPCCIWRVTCIACTGSSNLVRWQPLPLFQG